MWRTAARREGKATPLRPNRQPVVHHPSTPDLDCFFILLQSGKLSNRQWRLGLCRKSLVGSNASTGKGETLVVGRKKWAVKPPNFFSSPPLPALPAGKFVVESRMVNAMDPVRAVSNGSSHNCTAFRCRWDRKRRPRRRRESGPLNRWGFRPFSAAHRLPYLYLPYHTFRRLQ